MNKITCLALAAGCAVGLFPLSAAQAHRDAEERASWAETVRQVRLPINLKSSTPIEGRNVTTERSATIGVEPYIARRIEADRRSDR